MAEPRRCPLDALELTRDDGNRCPRKNVHMVTQETLWRISPRFSLQLAEKPSKSFSKTGRTAAEGNYFSGIKTQIKGVRSQDFS